MKRLVKIFPIAFLFFPYLALAQSAVKQGLNVGSFGSMFGSGFASNPTSDATTLILFIINILLFFAGAIAVLFVIIGGYQYITSGGNEETAEKGRKTLVNAVIGVIVVILSYAIVTVVQNTITPY